MKTTRNKVHLVVMMLILVWIIQESYTTSNINVGKFTSNSASVKAHHGVASNLNASVVFPGIVGAVGAYVGLLAVAYEGGYVVGRIGTALYYLAEGSSLLQVKDPTYNAYAFAEYDN